MELKPEPLKPAEWQYGLCAVDPKTGEVLHYAAYPSKPIEVDEISLKEELLASEKFGLTDVEFIIIHAPNYIVNMYQAILKKTPIELEEKED